eukprot:CAMPEP_0174242100 /NCGR_PEP_ID=MMETSP0417-20130205/26393_1 /TAXON_ID=242541 /ORGANISM="Mayorella sp, Strain BSH-02190019" /LENGTH=344 /DNA_ID=CAMNT_0015321455 /DNA_START=78 /DNA_END=1109 /DNA_ORIENTATION=+
MSIVSLANFWQHPLSVLKVREQCLVVPDEPVRAVELLLTKPKGDLVTRGYGALFVNRQVGDLVRWETYRFIYPRFRSTVASLLPIPTLEEASEEEDTARVNYLSHIGSWFASHALMSLATHPFSVAGTWVTCQQPTAQPSKIAVPRILPLRYWNEVSTAWNEIGQTEGKSYFDGLGARLFSTVCVSTLHEYLCNQVDFYMDEKSEKKIESLVQLQGIHVNSLREILLRKWTRSMTVGVLTALSYSFVKSLFYPLMTVCHRMEAQGVSDLLPIRYSNSLDCATSIIREEGVRGLFAGFQTHLLSLLPELVLSAGFLVVGAALIKITPEKVLKPLYAQTAQLPMHA